jgi:hypothetical protein
MTYKDSLSEYQRAARQKWPTSRIFGDGKYALVCPVSYSVHLYAYYMLALTEIARDHSNWQCKDSHTLVELKPVPPPRSETITRYPADCERD